MSIYIHIPFCSNICSYCDFCKMFYNEKMVNNYLYELDKEINSKYKKETIETLYIGGGTPSCLNIEQLKTLFLTIKKINFAPNIEFTFECNIDIDYEKLKFLYDNGVNRLSFGVQTFNKEFLKFLNRDNVNVEETIKMAKNIGFNNINVDLMYAFPNETLNDLNKDIKQFLRLDIQHISTYSLIIEPHTKLYVDKVENIDEDLDRKMYDLICKKLKKYDHYEISNFAIKGFYSKHNLTYWNNLNYYGFGLGASGYIDNIRYDNTRNIKKYLEGKYISTYDVLDKNSTIENEFILGLRKIKGINICNFNKKYGNIFYANVNRLIKEGKLINDGEYIYIKDIYTSNRVLVDFIGEKYE